MKLREAVRAQISYDGEPLNDLSSYTTDGLLISFDLWCQNWKQMQSLSLVRNWAPPGWLLWASRQVSLMLMQKRFSDSFKLLRPVTICRIVDERGLDVFG